MDLVSVFQNSPYFVKKIMINSEGVKRKFLRYYNTYAHGIESINYNELMTSGDFSNQQRLINNLINDINLKVPIYKHKNYKNLSDFPVIDKIELRDNYGKYISENLRKGEYVEGRTSGSTGTPFHYKQCKNALAYNYAYLTKHLEYIGKTKKDKCIRMSGIPLIPFSKNKPPYWIYIDVLQQLQMSSYHINGNTAAEYCKAINKINDGSVYGTGYPSSWLSLAEYCNEFNIAIPRLKFIRLDSEGITDNQKKYLENAFKCEIYQTYGLSEIGEIAIQCKYGNYHIIPDYTYVEIIPLKSMHSLQDDIGEIVVTLLRSSNLPIIRYRTGDLGKLGEYECICGFKTQYISKLEGRIDDYLIIENRKIGRLSQILKVEDGIVASQIIQIDGNKLIINIIPDKNYNDDCESMIKRNAKNYLCDIDIEIRKVKELIRNKNGKVKYVVRMSESDNYGQLHIRSDMYNNASK